MPKASRTSKVSRVVARRNDPLTSLSGSTRVAARTTAVATATDASGAKETSAQAISSTAMSSVEDRPSIEGGQQSLEQGTGSKSGVRTTISSSPVVDNDDEDGPASQSLSRGQRKRLAKRDQFLKKEKLILSSLMLQKQEEQKRRIDGLDAIKHALLNTTSTTVANTKATTTTNGKKIGTGTTTQMIIATNKAKRKLMVGEMEHMNLILQHPAYKADPFETMQQHLRNTFAEDRKQQESSSKQRATDEKAKAIEKAKLKKERLEGVKKRKNRKAYKPRRTV
jgi:hypothetical protein